MSNAFQATANRPRVLITRTRHQASALAAAVERMGADPILVPTIEVVPPDTFADLDHAIRMLEESADAVDWVIFTSSNAVDALANRAIALQAKISPRQIAVIGPATAKAVINAGLKPTIEPVLVPEEYVAESLALALLQTCTTAQRFLLIRAEEARDELPSQLTAAGHTIRIAAAYHNVTPEGTLPALQQTFSSPESYPQVITFTSSSTARNLVALLDSIGKKIPPSIALASIGPITSATLRGLGYEPTFEADEPTIDSLAIAIAKHLQRS